MEEILSNYEIHRKTTADLENDFEENIKMYIDAKRVEGLSDITLQGYYIELRLFARFVDKPTVQVNTSDIRKYLASNDTWMASTVDSKLSKIKSFYGWLVGEEIQLRNPASKIKPPKKPKRLPRGLSVEELEIVRESCKTIRERALIEVAYSTGARVSELANMKISDIDFRNMSIDIIGKGDKERIVYLSFKAMHHLNKYLKNRKESRFGKSDYVFIGERRPFREMTTSGIERVVNKIEERANISKKLTPHVFRHTFATLSMENGASITDVQHLLGHDRPETTQIYAIVSEERKKQAHRRYHAQ
ncbi:integrase [Oceanobacillus arenosus]|uniref:Integrase n=2 Tax=Oceanobacillus arenosus TaxID=1229153 RepID=A0A3D8PQS6_9BACI|nr:integrase [Oceanobacillus arenosus]